MGELRAPGDGSGHRVVGAGAQGPAFLETPVCNEVQKCPWTHLWSGEARKQRHDPGVLKASDPRAPWEPGKGHPKIPTLP